ncbi:MAG TPA: hypothetical protein VLK33_13600 [Terriglobales bacterium]|nr:hypothetical protein [Terriglobales bacterium]
MHATALTGSQKQWTRYVLPSVSDLIFLVLLFALSMGSLAPRLLGDGDTGWHIRNGELILSTHTITRVDPFSSTMQGKTWYAWEWLYDVAIARLHGWYGLNGVVFGSAFVIAVTFSLMFLLAQARGGSLAGTVLLSLLAITASSIHFLARPHILSWVLTLLWFHLLDSSETTPSGGRKLLWLPAIMLLWVNVHGGFVIGFVLLGICALTNFASFRFSKNQAERDIAGKRFWRIILVGIACAFTSLINPFGLQLHIHIYRYLSNRFLMNQISEFQPPNFHGIAQQCFVLLVLVAIAALARRKREPRPIELLVALFAVASGLYASRNLPTSSILLTLIIAPYLSRHSEERSDAEPQPEPKVSRLQSFAARMQCMDRQLRGHVWPGILVVLGTWACIAGGRVGGHQLISAKFSEKQFPVAAVDTIQLRQFTGPIFLPDSWGGYLIYRLYPGMTVVDDDRHDLYGEQFFKEYLQLTRLEPGWEDILKKSNATLVLMPAKSPLAGMLAEKPEWSMEYRDNTSALFRKK